MLLFTQLAACAACCLCFSCCYGCVFFVSACTVLFFCFVCCFCFSVRLFLLFVLLLLPLLGRRPLPPLLLLTSENVKNNFVVSRKKHFVSKTKTLVSQKKHVPCPRRASNVLTLIFSDLQNSTVTNSDRALLQNPLPRLGAPPESSNWLGRKRNARARANSEECNPTMSGGWHESRSTGL